MPEMRFLIRWPNGRPESCYSPSLVVKEHLETATSYTLDDFVARTRTALTIASARVEAIYGRPCSLALAQLARIEAAAASFPGDAMVAVEAFQDC